MSTREESSHAQRVYNTQNHDALSRSELHLACGSSTVNIRRFADKHDTLRCLSLDQRYELQSGARTGFLK